MLRAIIKTYLLLSCSLVVVLCMSAGVAAAQNAASTSAPAVHAAPAVGGNQVVHILVGHSVVINTEARLKRVMIGNPAILSSVTTAPSQIVVTALTAGSSSLVLFHEDDSARLVDVFADIDVSALRESVERAFPNDNLQIEAEGDKIVLLGTASSTATSEQVMKMAAPFSKELVNSMRVAVPARQKQVLLKVMFAEVNRGKLSEFGINLLSTGAANTIGTVTTQQFAPANLATSQSSRASSARRIPERHLRSRFPTS